MSSRDEFVFTWRVDNIRAIEKLNRENIESPICRVRQFFNTRWQLKLSFSKPEIRRKYLMYTLERKEDSGPDIIKVLLKVYVNSHIIPPKTHFVQKGNCQGPTISQIPLENILHDNVCVLACHMTDVWYEATNSDTNLYNFDTPESLVLNEIKHLMPSTEYRRLRDISWWYPWRCFARTRIAGQERTITCPMKEIMHLGRDKKIFLPLLSSNKPALLIVLHKTFTANQFLLEQEKLQVSFHFLDQWTENVLLFYKMQILYSDGEIESREGDHFYKTSEVYDFATFEVFLDNANMEENETDVRFNVSIFEDVIFSSIESSDSSIPPVTPKETDRKFGDDMFLKVKERYFSFQKSLLMEHSPVFAAMINRDSRLTPKIFVDGLPLDTVGPLKAFINTGVIENLDWEMANKLITVADQFQIKFLKKHCRDFLKENLSISRLNSILPYVYTCKDKELKDCVKDFIHQNAVFLRQEWTIFADSNLPLAAEIFQHVYSKCF